MISVDEALSHLFALSPPREAELVPLRAAAGRVLAKPVSALRDQPPFAASTMDGYALGSSHAHPGAVLNVVGEAAAGHRWEGRLGTGEALRIFTGAPLPPGADRVIIQEDVTRSSSQLTLNSDLESGTHIRPAGADFKAGHEVSAPRRLGPSDVALLAAMGIGEVWVTCQPTVAIIATGDELVMPGEAPGPDQITASNIFGLAALAEAEGAKARILPIARDTEASLKSAFSLAKDADLIVTVGGASVGDHDLVGAVAQAQGMERAFYKIAMRPGKPLMAGRMGEAVMLGLPGNPVSAMVCGHIFMLPMLRAMMGLGAMAPSYQEARLGTDLPANGRRAHYMRARVTNGTVTPAASQDSALLSVLADANALLVRQAHAPAALAGETVQILPI
ncbi:molybdopterin molybdochelatase [Roseovarius nanhaiticus]|uniref:Molybdopterin molybdenumtransferase n=1 Tax=Roseovarius nanhaiticus TaxID=573024 RepID=A0A1N7G893_9RHOB|nr:gephyrin-like molybdotransferase Glp [Roseovarius nanhaiticus]SEK34406.1 molybdopterin molybdotransferase [Roseovarius nanhaiticus]SIS08821.1 molybdopterin molybdochelatase [Roseovarius nanhaiticus]